MHVIEILTWEDDSGPQPHLWLALGRCWRRGQGKLHGLWSCWSSCWRRPAWPGPAATSGWSSGTACPARPASAVQPPAETGKYFCKNFGQPLQTALTSISPSVRRSFVGKREFLRIRPPSQDLSTLFARSVIDFAPPNPSRLIPFSEPSGDLGWW